MFDNGRSYFLGRSHIRLAPFRIYMNLLIHIEKYSDKCNSFKGIYLRILIYYELIETFETKSVIFVFAASVYTPRSSQAKALDVHLLIFCFNFHILCLFQLQFSLPIVHAGHGKSGNLKLSQG